MILMLQARAINGPVKGQEAQLRQYPGQALSPPRSAQFRFLARGLAEDLEAGRNRGDDAGSAGPGATRVSPSEMRLRWRGVFSGRLT